MSSILAGSLLSCSSGPRYATSTDSNPAIAAPLEAPISDSIQSALTREQANDRSKQITHVSYELWFSLHETLPTFEGRNEIRFDLTPEAKSIHKKIRLDLEGGTLTSIKINGEEVQNPMDSDRFDGHHITFRISELKPQGNRIEISYNHPYSSDGNGLHRFLDPADEQTYIYSNFEPYNAHRVFPCFDQPDLKATYQLTAEVPAQWTVISSTLPHKIGPNPARPTEARKIWKFPISSIFSTYLFSLHAGPYESWAMGTFQSNIKLKKQAETAPAVEAPREIPIRLFVRKSMAKYVDHKEWLEITKNGLEFYSTQFGYPYPFGKYDQILVPDFNAGAMENVAAVTFSENFIFRSKVTEDRRRSRADVILHEMAHMWFGNLVTMKWWNGLWLNESFATYMAAWAVDQATTYKGSWNSFARMKNWAYWEDQLATTHPVELPVQDTLQAQSNFDGITYGKGASSLQQLRFFLGEDDFREGLQRYFQRFAFQNTTIHDFFKMLSEASNQPLGPWQKLWLQTPGVNSVQTTWKCDVDPTSNQAQEISQLEIKQFSEPLRPHRAQIALYHQARKHSTQTQALQLTQTLSATYTNASTLLTEAVGQPCPDFVFPNFGNQDYVKIEFDAQAIEFISKNFKEFADPLVRQMLWHALWEMVVDGKMKAKQYAELILNYGSLEKDTLVLDRILGQLISPFSNVASVTKYMPRGERKTLDQKIEKFMFAHLAKSPAGSDLQLIWYKHALNAAKSPKSMEWIKNLLTKRIQLPSFKVDQERRWELVQALARSGDVDTEVLIQAELDRDQTDAGEKQSIAAEVQIPDATFKKKWLKNILRQQSADARLPVSKLKEAMSRFQLLDQELATQFTVKTYFETVSQLQSAPVEEDEYATSFTRSMFPSLCSSEIATQTQRFLADHSDLKPALRKILRIALQEEERCIRARKL